MTQPTGPKGLVITRPHSEEPPPDCALCKSRCQRRNPARLAGDYNGVPVHGVPICNTCERCLTSVAVMTNGMAITLRVEAHEDPPAPGKPVQLNLEALWGPVGGDVSGETTT